MKDFDRKVFFIHMEQIQKQERRFEQSQKKKQQSQQHRMDHIFYHINIRNLHNVVFASHLNLEYEWLQSIESRFNGNQIEMIYTQPY